MSRAVSQVTGVILMVGVVIVLSATTWVLIESLATEPDVGPDVGFSANPERTPPTMKLTNVYGEPLNRDNVEIKGGVIISDTGSSWDSGEQLLVFPTDKQVQVLWKPESEEGQILYQTPKNLPPVRYERDKQSSYTINSGSTLLGGARSENGYVKTGTNTTVFGRINAQGAVEVEDNSVVYRGVVSRQGSVNVGQNSIIYGDVKAQNDIDIEKNTTVNGGVKGNSSSTDIDIKSNTVILGSIITDSSSDGVSIEDNTVVKENVDAVGKVSLSNNVTVEGDVTSQTAVQTSSGARVGGTITMTNSNNGVTIGPDNVIGGINANASNDDVVVGQDSIIQGNIDAETTVILKNGVTVKGTVTAPTVSCGQDVTTQGDSC